LANILLISLNTAKIVLKGGREGARAVASDGKLCKNQRIASKGGKREGSGRPKKLTSCVDCGALLSAWERQRHKCPKRFRPVGRPRKTEPSTTPIPPQEIKYFDNKEERRRLVELISRWRAAQGLGNSARILSNRSLDQLRKMRDQIEQGKIYRMGRRWNTKEGA
jgi:hypothetical protein